MKTNIWWIRRDLRLQNNPTLKEAIVNTQQLLPVYILDLNLLKKDAPRRHRFIFQALDSLNQSLLSVGSRLLIQSGEPALVLQQLVSLTGAEMIFAEEDYSPYARKRDQQVAASSPLCLVHGLTAFPPGMVLKSDGSPYTVFTPYKNAWKSLPISSLPSLQTPIEKLPPLPDNLPPSVPLPDHSPSPDFPASQTEAEQRLENFFNQGLVHYNDFRDRMDLEGTSRLSPYLRFGLLSPQTTIHKLQSILPDLTPNERVQAETWQNELIWREFYISILHHFPEVMQASFRKDLRNIRWRNNPVELDAWKNGLTGYPIVDAGMRQLLATGWMHNRARMITASFLVKDLLINWQMGEDWFMQQLLDADPAANNGGWQWTAGVGTDAAPYFRIFNPILQGKKFDPQGAYVRRWVPELASVPDEHIHTPWTLPLTDQARLGISIGKHYPLPIVDHKQMRAQTLEAYHAR